MLTFMYISHYNNTSSTQIPHLLTWVENSRPGKSILGVVFYIESDVEVENTKILLLNLNIQEKRPYDPIMSINVLIRP